MPWWAFILPIVFLTGCSEPPPVPRLASHKPPSIDRILLDDKLTAKDIREILTALNDDGALQGFVSSFSALPDKTVEDLANLINRWGREDRRILGLLRSRVAVGSFSQWHGFLAKERDFEGAKARHELLWELLSDDSASRVFEQAHLFLDPAIAAGWNRAKRQSDASFVVLAKSKSVAPEILGEGLWRLIERDEYSDLTRPILASLLKNAAYEDFYRGMTRFTSPSSFEALRLGLGRMLATGLLPNQKITERSNQLDLLLYLAETTGNGTEKLFETFETGLKTFSSAISGSTQNTLQRIVSRVLAERVRLHFSSKVERAHWVKLATQTPEKDAVIEVYGEILKAWRPMVGEAGPSQQAGYRLAVHLNAYVTAKWLVAQMRAHGKALSELPEQRFGETVWSLPLVPQEVVVDFAKSMGGGFVFPEAEWMKEGMLSEVAVLVESYVKGKVEAPLRFSYQLALGTDKTTLSQALSEAMIRIDRRRKILSGEAVTELVLQYLTEPTLSSGMNIASFETDDTLTLLNTLLTKTKLERFRAIRRFLFVDLKLGTMDPDQESFVLELFGSNPEKMLQVKKILASLQSLVEFDTPIKPELASPFEAYHAVLTESSVARLSWVAEALTYLSRLRVAGVDAQNGPRFAFFYEGVQSEALGRWLHTFSLLDNMEWERLRSAIFALDDGTEAFDLAKRALSSHREGWVTSFSFLDKNPLPPGLNLLEFDWLRSRIALGDHRVLFDAFDGATRAQWREMVSELLKLERAKRLRHALQLMGLLRDEFFRDLSKILVEASDRGELEKALESLDWLLL